MNIRQACFSAFLLLFSAQLSADDKRITVFHSPSGQCCEDWISHLKSHGFHVHQVSSEKMSLKKSDLGIPKPLHTCHTATVDGYVLEGRVPARDIRRLLDKRPKVVGIAAIHPPMPKAPETPINYDVLSFDEDQSVSIFSSF